MIRFPLALLVACSEYEVENFSVHDAWQAPDDVISADILFVVDNSASMLEEQVRLADNFSAFVDVLDESRADWRLGVTVTDLADAATMREGVMGPRTADLEQVFRRAVLVGSAGSRTEQGFLSAQTCLEANYDAFVREGADLSVVFISDEDDQSPGGVEAYIEGMAGFAGAGTVQLHALVGDLPEGCASGSTAADAGGRYLEAAGQTGGLHESICAEDYSDILSQVGLTVAGWQSLYPLSALATPGTISVKVDGVLIPEREIDGWQYAIGDNAVEFDGRAIPRPGMWVEIDYQRWTGGTREAAPGTDTGTDTGGDNGGA